jgi:hypothetical protein
MDLRSAINEFDQKLKKMREELSEEFKKKFKVICKDIFEKYPDIIKFGWTQYTPYFNDGDPCVFRYNDMYVCNDPETADESIYEWESTYSLGKKYPEIRALDKILGSSSDILLEMFGDHVQITITPKGIDVEEYEHD